MTQEQFRTRVERAEQEVFIITAACSQSKVTSQAELCRTVLKCLHRTGTSGDSGRTHYGSKEAGAGAAIAVCRDAHQTLCQPGRADRFRIDRVHDDSGRHDRSADQKPCPSHACTPE